MSAARSFSILERASRAVRTATNCSMIFMDAVCHSRASVLGVIGSFALCVVVAGFVGLRHGLRRGQKNNMGKIKEQFSCVGQE